MLRGAGSIVGAYLVLERIQPVPTIGVFREFNIGTYPKTVISLQNASFGPLIIHKIQLYSNGRPIHSFHDIISSKKYILCSVESVHYMAAPIAIAGYKELLTIRPENVHDTPTYFNTFCDDVSKKEIEIEIEFSASTNFILNFLTKTTRKMSICSQYLQLN